MKGYRADQIEAGAVVQRKQHQQHIVNVVAVGLLSNNRPGMIALYVAGITRLNDTIMPDR